MTTGSFYVHFDKKEDLFAAIVEEDLSEYLRIYDGMLDRLSAKAQRENARRHRSHRARRVPTHGAGV